MKTQRERLIEVFQDVFFDSRLVAGLNEKTILEDDLGADSMDVCEIAMKIEDEFLTDAPDDILHTWNTFGDVLRWVEKNAPTEEVIAKTCGERISGR